MKDDHEHKKIELLAPARNPEAARAAVDCGADAVYIGGPRFGARRSAGNSTEDIAAVAEYAHRFGSRVYVTLNTVLFEDELRDAESIARQVVAAGADALIVQDMAYMEMGLRGVELHASTQTFNAAPGKVAFLASTGFSRVILERNLSLEEIKAIRRASDVELECFVHGAVCVCYSGRCYMSRSMSPRSGNRGDCSQPCRLSYDLAGPGGQVLHKGRHLLSVKDMDLSARLGELLDAGIVSFKIEGRLKDTAYVKNTVAWYSRRIDEELALRPWLRRASSGRCESGFVPDLERTFSRGRTEYFFDGRRSGVSTPDTPKATGSYIGSVSLSGKGWFGFVNDAGLSAGDGVCFMYGGQLEGTNVISAEGKRIRINKDVRLAPGTEIYRNYDRRFNAALVGSRSRRTLAVRAEVSFSDGGMSVVFTDEDGVSQEVSCDCGNCNARDTQKMLETIRTQLSRSGDTVFNVQSVDFVSCAVGLRDVPFVRVSRLNALRREGLGGLLLKRIGQRPVKPGVIPDNGSRYPYGVPDSFGNVTNSLARKFYERYGAAGAEPGYDLKDDLRGVAVMTTPFCIRRENGLCRKGGSGSNGPLQLKHGNYAYRLEFDCGKCLMKVIFEGSL